LFAATYSHIVASNGTEKSRKKWDKRSILGSVKNMAKHLPRGLSSEAQRLFREVVAQNGLDTIADGASMTLLENACRCLDRLRLAEAAVKRDGAWTKDRFGQAKASAPAQRVDIENQTICRLLAGIVNHSAAASFKRAQALLHGVGTGESHPWTRQDAV
jgi:hypothetical protein